MRGGPKIIVDRTQRNRKMYLPFQVYGVIVKSDILIFEHFSVLFLAFGPLPEHLLIFSTCQKSINDLKDFSDTTASINRVVKFSK